MESMVSWKSVSPSAIRSLLSALSTGSGGFGNPFGVLKGTGVEPAGGSFSPYRQVSPTAIPVTKSNIFLCTQYPYHTFSGVFAQMTGFFFFSLAACQTA
jgi:hypothetical protein